MAAVVLLLAMEALLRVLPAPKGLHRENPRTRASSARLLRNHEYTFSMGWDLRHPVHGRTNRQGFISPHDYAADVPALALIGDSFAEGEMLLYDESLAGNLEARLGPRMPVYNFGLSGAALPHYLGMAREAGARYRLSGAVIVVVPGDYVEGFLDQEGVYKWSKRSGDLIELVPAAQRSEFVQLARESALLHYARGNLKLSAATIFSHSAVPVCVPQRLATADHERLASFVDALPRALRLPADRIVMVFNTNTRLIYAHVDAGNTAGRPCPDVDTLALRELRALAVARGMRLVEVAQLLEADYRKYRRPLDFRPVDPHWNGVATALIAGEVSRQLAAPRDAGGADL